MRGLLYSFNKWAATKVIKRYEDGDSPYCLDEKHAFDYDNSDEDFYINGEDLFAAFKAGYDKAAQELE